MVETELFSAVLLRSIFFENVKERRFFSVLSSDVAGDSKKRGSGVSNTYGEHRSDHALPPDTSCDKLLNFRTRRYI